jgi:hypothetical protein
MHLLNMQLHQLINNYDYNKACRFAILLLKEKKESFAKNKMEKIQIMYSKK